MGSRQIKLTFFASFRKDAIVPFAVEWCRLEIDGGQLRIGDLDSQGVSSRVEFGFDLQALGGCRVGDQVNDYVVADQWTATPVLCDVAEHPMFALVPFTGARREMTNMDRNPQLVGQFLQRHFPRAGAAAVAAAIGHDQQTFRPTMTPRSHLLPPATNCFRRGGKEVPP